ncbi:hypothetical protein PG990_002873 [Apiospora arundinis]
MPSPAKDTAKGLQATDQEARFFFIILSNMKGAPSVDWETVAKQAGYSSSDVARSLIASNLKNRSASARSRSVSASPPVPPPASPATPKVAKRRARNPPAGGKVTKRTKVLDAMDDDNDDILWDDDEKRILGINQKVKVDEDEGKVLKDEDEA